LELKAKKVGSQEDVAIKKYRTYKKPPFLELFVLQDDILYYFETTYVVPLLLSTSIL
jgi:hypothetical protein